MVPGEDQLQKDPLFGIELGSLIIRIEDEIAQGVKDGLPSPELIVHGHVGMVADHQIGPHVQIGQVAVSDVGRRKRREFLSSVTDHHAPAALFLYFPDPFPDQIHLVPEKAASQVLSRRLAAPAVAHGDHADAAGLFKVKGPGGVFQVHAGAHGHGSELFRLFQGVLKSLLARVHDVVVVKIPDVCVHLLQHPGDGGVHGMHQAQVAAWKHLLVRGGKGAFYVGADMAAALKEIQDLRSDQVRVLPLSIHVFVKADVAGKGKGKSFTSDQLLEGISPVLEVFKIAIGGRGGREQAGSAHGRYLLCRFHGFVEVLAEQAAVKIRNGPVDPLSRFVAEYIDIVLILPHKVSQEVIVDAPVHAADDHGSRVGNAADGLDGRFGDGGDGIVVIIHPVFCGHILQPVGQAFEGGHGLSDLLRIAAVDLCADVIDESGVVLVVAAPDLQIISAGILIGDLFFPGPGIEGGHRIAAVEIILLCLEKGDVLLGGEIPLEGPVIVQMLLVKVQKYRRMGGESHGGELVAGHFEDDHALVVDLPVVVQAGIAYVAHQEGLSAGAGGQDGIKKGGSGALSLGARNAYGPVPELLQKELGLGGILCSKALCLNAGALDDIVPVLFIDPVLFSFIYGKSLHPAEVPDKTLRGLSFPAVAPDQYSFAFQYVSDLHFPSFFPSLTDSSEHSKFLQHRK